MTGRPFGPTGRRVSIIGQGTWELERTPRREAIAALQRGLDLGLTHLDTAELYGRGAVEELVGEALAGRREQAFVASKVLPAHASAEGVVRACEASLTRLRIERLDLYLLHSPSSRVPFFETLRGLEALVSAGKIAAFGVSNFDAAELAAAVATAGPGRIACNQVLYNLGTPDVERTLWPLCVREGVALVGYTPFGAMPRPDTPLGRALAAVAQARGCSTHQVTLAFLTRLDGTFAIPKAARPAHLAENAAAGALELTATELARLERARESP